VKRGGLRVFEEPESALSRGMRRYGQRQLRAADYQGLRAITRDSGRENLILPRSSTHASPRRRRLGRQAVFLGAVALTAQATRDTARAMSRENVELVSTSTPPKRACRAVRRRGCCGRTGPLLRPQPGESSEVVQDEAHTWTLEDGKIARFEWGRDLGRALEAAGLRE
jgi:hypothetical protein